MNKQEAVYRIENGVYGIGQRITPLKEACESMEVKTSALVGDLARLTKKHESLVESFKWFKEKLSKIIESSEAVIHDAGTEKANINKEVAE